jgi:HSP20 family protein
MTLYITPNRRALRRRTFGPDFSWPDVFDSQVYFPVDVKAEPEAFVITALLPGLKPDEINIQIVDETVSIQGEFKGEAEANDSYLIKERPAGSFNRVITLPDPLDADRAEASFDQGVLTLRVPKAESARPKTIKINTK